MLILDETSANAARAQARMLTQGSLGQVANGFEQNVVLPRWQRARALGVTPSSHAYPEGTSGSDLATRRERLADVFREEGALLGPIAGELAARAMVAIIADPDGVILATHGGGTFMDPAARIRLVCGARWSENARGTNAIGTAIAEARSVAVIGSAHYEERNHGLFCYATPIHDAYGDVAAVLDVTGSMTAHDPSIGFAVQAAGAGLERALKAIAYAQAGASVMRTIERLVHGSITPAFVCDPDGALTVANAAAFEELGLDPQKPPTCERVFGTTYRDLLRVALDGDRPRFETAHATYDVVLDPILSANGRALGLAIHLERGRKRFAALRAARGANAPRALPPLAKARAAARSDRAINAPLPIAFDPIFSDDPQVTRAKAEAARFAKTDLPVLLLAETGTGKELFARAIHGASSRAKGPFVALNCGAFTETLLESELFGYAPHAFTGASQKGAEGKLAAADGGTLFLDEIAEMPERVQAALLRVLDDGFYCRVGEAKPRRADFRLACATCRDLPDLVSRGKFRQDLFYRIYGASVVVPPLREREDIVELSHALLASALKLPATAPSFAPDAIDWLRAHDWPGNVRELKHALSHALAMHGDAGDDDRIELSREHFPRPLALRRAPNIPTRADVVSDAIREALDACNGNVTLAAKRLGVARSTLYRSKSRTRS